MVIFKPTAILVYFKKRKEALKIDLGYHIQKKKTKKNPRCQLFILLCCKQICQQFLWVKVSEHCGGNNFCSFLVGFGLVGWWFFKKK